MATVRLRIEADLCGPVSVGTVRVIRLLSERLGLPLSEAEALVDACVFEGREVQIEVPTSGLARDLIEALAQTQAGPRIHAAIAQM